MAKKKPTKEDRVNRKIQETAAALKRMAKPKQKTYLVICYDFEDCLDITDDIAFRGVRPEQLNLKSLTQLIQQVLDYGGDLGFSYTFVAEDEIHDATSLTAKPSVKK